MVCITFNSHTLKQLRFIQQPLDEPYIFIMTKTLADNCKGFYFGGDKQDRTADLLNAIQALSQLSYIPITSGITIQQINEVVDVFPQNQTM